MTTYLQLCKDTRAKLKFGSGPSTVKKQTGRIGLVVSAVAKAWETIQSESEYWKFLRVPASAVEVSAGVSTYTETHWPVISSINYVNAIRFASDNKPLSLIDYDVYLQSYAKRSSVGSPTHYTIDLDNNIILVPTPNESVSLEIDYQQVPQELVEDGDVPVIATELHDIIKWRALFELASDLEDSTVYSEAVGEYERKYQKLANRYLPDFSIGKF